MKIDINLVQNPYSVFIDEEFSNCDECVILTNESLKNLLLQPFLDKSKLNPKAIICIKDGEIYKNFETLNYVLNEMFKLNLSRKATLINLGGGVISDLGGFAASIYKRGIKHINIATTLLASFDAAVGGKTGINNEFGKNLIGTFKQPEAVYIFTEFFASLPRRELSAAMAELIKMALCFRRDFYEELKNIKNPLENAARLCEMAIKMKADVVAKDERESGLRMLLNYGHTFAHVIERQGAYAKFLHGEAVAIGMNLANDLSVELGLISREFADEIRGLLAQFGLDFAYKIDDENAFYQEFFQDKKSEENCIKFVLLNEKGADIYPKIEQEKVLKILKNFR